MFLSSLNISDRSHTAELKLTSAQIVRPFFSTRWLVVKDIFNHFGFEAGRFSINGSLFHTF
jgi:hypothetical protein